MLIREMTGDDLQAIIEVGKRCNVYKDSDIPQVENTLPFYNTWVLTDKNMETGEETIIGFYTIRDEWDFVAEYGFAIDVPYRHKGLGTILMNHMLFQAKKYEGDHDGCNCDEIISHVLAADIETINFYQKFGFGIRHGYTEENGDEYLCLSRRF